MNELGKEYAAALFMLAAEDGSQRGYYDGLEVIRSVFD